MNAQVVERRLLRRERRRTRQTARGLDIGRPRGGIATALTLLGTVTAAGAVGLAMLPERQADGEAPNVRAGRRLNRAAGTLAGSVLFDSAIEHYAGAFQNKAMYAPLAIASLALAASLHGHRDRDPAPHPFRDTVYTGAALTGVAGTLFHVYNVTKRPGGICFQNLFYGAPLGAPAALILSGAMGFLGERARDNVPDRLPTILGFTAGRAIAAMTGIGLFGTAGEAGLLHLRGAFHNPFMLLPVTVPPITGFLVGRTALTETRHRPVTRWWLRCTALLGLVGAAFHCVGVARNMGGWRNWSQNVLNGPPIPAPPAFAGLALAGLAAIGLQQDHPND